MEKIKIIKREMNYETMIKEEMDSKWLEVKVNNFISKHPFLGLNKTEVYEKIEQDKAFAMFFIKNPGKQRIGLDVVERFLLGSELVEGLTSLNTKHSYVESHINLDGDCRLFDFIIHTNKKSYYVIYSGLEGSGGTQNMSIKKILNTLERCKNSRIIVFVSGSAYTDNVVKNMKEKGAIVITENNFVNWEDNINE